MSDNTKIEWTDATWNPVTGCSVTSPGCTNCYAMKLAGTRMKHTLSRAGLTIDTKAGPVWNGEVRLNEQWLDQPLRWKRPRRIFVCAHGDLFHENVPDEWIDRVFAVMALCPQHTFQVLTKRSARMRTYVSEQSRLGHVFVASQTLSTLYQHKNAPRRDQWPYRRQDWRWPLRNVWLGVSVEDQQRADERREDFASTPAEIKFVSYEPALGPVDWLDWDFVDQIISGGESGLKARPTHPDWHRHTRDFCAAHDIAFFFKQWGEWHPSDDPDHPAECQVREIMAFRQDHSQEWRPGKALYYQLHAGWLGMCRVGKRFAGRLLDGVEHNGMPGHG